MRDGAVSRKTWRGRMLAVALPGVVMLGISLLGVSLPASGQALLPSLPETVQPISVSAKALRHFKISAPGQRRFGKLEFRGGLVLESKAATFGGWSGLAIDRDGRKFLAVSDAGFWMSGRIDYAGKAPAGIAEAKVGAIRALRGRVITSKRDLDAESVAFLDGRLEHGTLLVSFERNHRVGLFPVKNSEISAPARYLPRSSDMRRMQRNKGFEAVATVNGGRFKGSIIAIAERYPGDEKRHRGWMWVKGKPEPFELSNIGAFDITDAVTAEDGTLYVLERRFRWIEGVKMRIRRFAAESVQPGAMLEGEVLIEADMSFEIDNMEGLTLHKGSDGETILTLISDNNFNGFLQRNLLLQFAVLADRRSARGP